MTDEERIKRVRARALQLAQDVINGKLRVLAGCRALSVLGPQLVDDWRKDADFVVFGRISSDTDHLPLEDQREQWEPAVFDSKQVEVQGIEESLRGEVIIACRSITARFGDA